MSWKIVRPDNRQSPAAEKSIPPGLRIYAVGDIHGCAANLDRLHAAILADLEAGHPREVLIIYLGDYVDRGPDSAGVLERLTRPAPAAISRKFLKGNHEEMMLQFLAAPEQESAWCDFGGLETLLSYRIDINAVRSNGGYSALSKALAACLPAHHKQFLDELENSFSVGDYFFCHAGIKPGVPLEQQNPYDLLWIRDEFLRSDRDHGKIIIHGHSPGEEPQVCANRIDIDTGAYATGCLTALALEGTTRRFLFA